MTSYAVTGKTDREYVPIGERENNNHNVRLRYLNTVSEIWINN